MMNTWYNHSSKGPFQTNSGSHCFSLTFPTNWYVLVTFSSPSPVANFLAAAGPIPGTSVISPVTVPRIKSIIVSSLTRERLGSYPCAILFFSFFMMLLYCIVLYCCLAIVFFYTRRKNTNVVRCWNVWQINNHGARVRAQQTDIEKCWCTMWETETSTLPRSFLNSIDLICYSCCC